MQTNLPLAPPPALIFLGMNSKTVAAVIAARPELKGLKAITGDTTPKCRKLGTKGDPNVRQLANGEADGAIVVGFNIPANIAARAERVIEIPIGQNIPRTRLGEALEENEYEALGKALAAMVRIPLKAYITQTVSLTHGFGEQSSEGEEEAIDF